MPGLYWHHPHSHGSATLQVMSANGLIVVEDDPAWLPDANGCGPLRTLLESVPDVLLHLGVFTFAPSAYIAAGETGFAANMDDANIQTYAQYVDLEPVLPTCCNDTVGEYDGVPTGLMGNASDTDFIVVNGGLRPRIQLQTGRFQRWRLAHTGYKRFAALTIRDSTTGQPTNDCELLLVSKDGVYLLEAPRAVDYMHMGAANRAELLVRCSGAPGTNYTIASGTGRSPFLAPGAVANANNQYGWGSYDSLTQAVVATIEMVAPEGDAGEAPPQKGCRPLRAAYASDLRPKTLQALGTEDRVVKDQYVKDGVGVPYNVTAPMGTSGIGFNAYNSSITFGCLLNGKNFSYPDPKPLTMELGTVVEYDWQNIGW